MMNGVIVGAGFMGKTHLNAYESRKDVKIVCVVDRDEQKAQNLAHAQGCQVRTELSQVLSDWDVDFVDVCLPSTLHRQAVITALDAKAHVLVEKPFAVTLEDVDAMILASQSSGKRLMVAHVCRFMPQYQYVKEAVETNRLGRPLLFSAWRLSETPAWSWNNWLQNKALSGGTLLDLSIHDLDIANWLFGTPTNHALTEISSMLIAGPSHVISRLSYPGMETAIIEAGHLMPDGYPFSAGFRLTSEQGCIEYGTSATQPGEIVEFSHKRGKKVLAEALDPHFVQDPYKAEIHHFLDCLSTGEAFRISPAEARLAVRTVHALQESPV